MVFHVQFSEREKAFDDKFETLRLTCGGGGRRGGGRRRAKPPPRSRVHRPSAVRRRSEPCDLESLGAVHIYSIHVANVKSFLFPFVFSFDRASECVKIDVPVCHCFGPVARAAIWRAFQPLGSNGISTFVTRARSQIPMILTKHSSSTQHCFMYYITILPR